ncbi:hypothetical protein LU631_06105 [Erwinia tracheiphila]|uniref:Uncharacterized protein n=1 Tax=Erwinia tracheiphila TaxID=65700 RepID=A0A0M2KF02_9GAMM|nr:hypothetical protein [Erwinia tracheiphila]EOS95810.1 hypothetical protein ETR_06205 [Erwinia tracheiphila PSU-1]KKF37484.1 hypothetical protein SY86_22160 [Erwinia tracheiphila]UIA88887.1 hypothetical protein LU631_06105 [Erwinia tracheiphila]UIA97268.1 hypothetical protein LU633_04775 [Erwinia tracheiphila]
MSGQHRAPEQAFLKTIKSCLLPVLGLCAFSSQTLATVYVCTNDSCTTWTAITPTQLAKKSTDGENTTIQQMLSQSTEQSIVNGFSDPGIGNTNLYIKSSLRYVGGVEPFAGKQHVTAYIYKSTDLHTRLKTCHAFSFIKAGATRYFATCQ